MKKQKRSHAFVFAGTLFAGAAGALPDAAYGQASGTVRVYGRMVAGLNYQTNVPTGRSDAQGRPIAENLWSIDGNAWGANYLGITGAEALGAELQAHFILESGFDASTGQVAGGSGIWTRRALVGLTGPFGTLRVGRSLSLPTEVMWSLDPGGQQAAGVASLVKGRSWPTNSNQVDYTSPQFGGLTIQTVYGFGELPDASRKNRTGGVSVAYMQPAYELRAMYDFANDAEGRYSELFRYSKELTLGGTLTVGKVKLFAGYQRLAAPAVVTGPDRARHLWVGTNVWAGKATMLLGGLYQIDLNRGTGRARLLTLGANHYLSKRTLLYVTAATLRNNSQTDFAVQTYGGIPGRNQTAFYTGIAHSF